jgi:hypothetical protein
MDAVRREAAGYGRGGLGRECLSRILWLLRSQRLIGVKDRSQIRIYVVTEDFAVAARGQPTHGNSELHR